MNRWVMAGLVFFLLGLPAGRASACDVQTAMDQITSLTSRIEGPSAVEAAKQIRVLAQSCGHEMVKEYAAEMLSYGITGSMYPSVAIAEQLEMLCGVAERCSVRAVISVSKAVLGHREHPTLEAVRSIVNIVKMAPHPSVKNEAIYTLSSRCLSSAPHPTEECSRAMDVIAKTPALSGL